MSNTFWVLSPRQIQNMIDVTKLARRRSRSTLDTAKKVWMIYTVENPAGDISMCVLACTHHVKE